MNSSSETGLAPLATPELRTGAWTRFGSDAVLGDPVTEETLSTLAETTRTAARSQGYAVGWAEGVRAARAAADAEADRVAADRIRAEATRAEEHRAAVTALRSAAEQLHAETARVTRGIEDQAGALAWQLTRALMGSLTERLAPADAIRRVLDLAADAPITRVLLHPADLAAIAPADAVTLAEQGATLAADHTLRPGDAIVELDDHVLDLRIDAALERVREVLR